MELQNKFIAATCQQFALDNNSKNRCRMQTTIPRRASPSAIPCVNHHAHAQAQARSRVWTTMPTRKPKRDPVCEPPCPRASFQFRSLFFVFGRYSLTCGPSSLSCCHCNPCCSIFAARMFAYSSAACTRVHSSTARNDPFLKPPSKLLFNQHVELRCCHWLTGMSHSHICHCHWQCII